MRAIRAREDFIVAAADDQCWRLTVMEEGLEFRIERKRLLRKRATDDSRDTRSGSRPPDARDEIWGKRFGFLRELIPADACPACPGPMPGRI
jgi:hypothetical protein